MGRLRVQLIADEEMVDLEDSEQGVVKITRPTPADDWGVAASIYQPKVIESRRYDEGRRRRFGQAPVAKENVGGRGKKGLLIRIRQPLLKGKVVGTLSVAPSVEPILRQGHGGLSI